MLRAFIAALPGLQAERQLESIQAADAPHVSAGDRRDLFSSLRQRLAIDSKPEPATAADLAVIGIKVEHVPKKQKETG